MDKEVPWLLAKACDMLIDDLAARGWVVATESSRKCLQVGPSVVAVVRGVWLID